jgi:phosphohistidine phosphatase
MEIWILRHAVAERESKDGRDESRPLTAEAVERMKLAGPRIANLIPGLDAILSSPLLRAKQTAEPVVQAMGEKLPFIVSSALAPEAAPDEILSEIARRNFERVLLVGHMPHLGRLLGFLVTGRWEAFMKMKKGSLARVECEGSAPGPPATLTLLLTSKILIRLRDS